MGKIGMTGKPKNGDGSKTAVRRMNNAPLANLLCFIVAIFDLAFMMELGWNSPASFGIAGIAYLVALTTTRLGAMVAWTDERPAALFMTIVACWLSIINVAFIEYLSMEREYGIEYSAFLGVIVYAMQVAVFVLGLSAGAKLRYPSLMTVAVKQSHYA